MTYDVVELDESSTIVKLRRIQEDMLRGAEVPSLHDLRDALAG